MPQGKIVIRFDTDNPTAVVSIMETLQTVLPYMVDNVDITYHESRRYRTDWGVAQKQSPDSFTELEEQARRRNR